MTTKIYATGPEGRLQAPCGVVMRTNWGAGVGWDFNGVRQEGHVGGAVFPRGIHMVSTGGMSQSITVGPKRPATHKFRTFLDTYVTNMDIHYWFHRCVFMNGCRVTLAAQSALFTNCIFMGEIGLRLPDKPGGPVVVDRGRFLRNSTYGMFGPAEGLAVLRSVFRGPGSPNAHGIRIAGGQDVCIRRCMVNLRRAFTAITLRDGVNGRVQRYVLLHGTIADCGLGRKHHVSPMIQVSPQNDVTAQNGARIGLVDVLNNRIVGDTIQKRSIVVCADRVNIMDNRLHTDAPPNSTTGHIHLRKMGGQMSSNVHISQNKYLGTATDIEGKQA